VLPRRQMVTPRQKLLVYKKLLGKIYKLSFVQETIDFTYFL